MKEKKRLYWRFLIMLAILVSMAAGSIAYVAVDGSTFTAEISYFATDYVKIENVRLKVQDESIVAVDDYYYSGDALRVDVHSLNSGSTNITVSVLNPETGDVEGTQDIPLYVDGFGTVFQTDTMNFDGYFQVQLVIIGGVAVVFLFTGYTFIECFFKARFTYAMVACGGVALFTLFTVVLSIYDLIMLGSFSYFRFFLLNLADSGFEFSSFTLPFMLLLSLAIAVSNIWLLRHEGRRPQNMLGIGLAVGWFLGFAGIYGLFYAVFYVDNATFGNIALRLAYSLGYVLTFLECMLLSTIVSAFFSTKFKPPFNKDYIIILGCCIRDDGTLTPILRGRADAAIRFERAQYERTGKHAKFVPSGGQGADEVVSESEAMRRYLTEQGYPDEQIVKEDKSVNTDQNIQFSRDRILEDAGTLDGIQAAFATTNYHIFRGYILSNKHKLNAQGISAKTKWYFYPNAFLREFVGLLFEKKWFILVSVALLLTLYTIGVELLTMF